MKAVIYARVSSTGERQSNDRQVEDLQDYAAYRQYDVIKVFEEKITGYRRNRDRPVLIDSLHFCKDNHVDILLVSELSRLGRNAFEILEVIKSFIDCGINLYLQKEQLTLLDNNGKTTMFAPVVIATLATCAELERENIQYRLNSGREKYKREGGRLGRPSGTALTTQDLCAKHRDIVKLLKQGYPIRKVATLTGKSPSTVARVNKIREKD